MSAADLLRSEQPRWSASDERGFARTLSTGALAALALPVSVLALAPAIGAEAALALHAVIAVAAYLAVLAQRARARVATFVSAGVLGLLAWAIFGSSGSLLVVLSLGVALARSGVLFERRPLRAVCIEAVVLIAALSAARLLASPGLLGAALALWGWFVAQSFYFLLGGLARRRPRGEGDAFDTAKRRLEELLSD